MPHNLTNEHSVRHLITEFLADAARRVESNELEPETLASYRSSLTTHVLALGDLRICDLDRPTVRRWYRDCSQIARGAAKCAHARLRTMLSWAVDEGLLSENPAASLRAPYRAAPGRPFEADELAEFCRRCELEIEAKATRAKSERQRGWTTAVSEVLLICALTGSRSGVVRKATVDTWNPRKRSLYIPRSKSGKPLVVAMPDRAAAIFEWRVACHRGHLFLGRVQTGPVTWAGIYRGFQRIGGELARGRHPHDLRHTAATLAREAGEPLTDIMELLGHASMSMTLHYSATATSSRARGVAQRLERIGGGDA